MAEEVDQVGELLAVAEVLRVHGLRFDLRRFGVACGRAWSSFLHNTALRRGCRRLLFISTRDWRFIIILLL